MQSVLTIDKLNDMAAQIEATKLSLVTQEQGMSDHDKKVDRFIAEHQAEWKAIGEHYRLLRKSRGFTQSQVAEALGVSPTKISQFENGKCVSHANLLENAYSMFFAIDDEINGVLDIERYTDHIIGNIEEFVTDHTPAQHSKLLRSIVKLGKYLYDAQERLGAHVSPMVMCGLIDVAMEAKVKQDPLFINAMQRLYANN